MNRGYCRTKEQYVALRAYGLSDKEIYFEGRFAETLAACIASFRECAGTIFVFGARDETRRCGRYLIVSRTIPDWLTALIECKNLRRLCAAIP